MRHSMNIFGSICSLALVAGALSASACGGHVAEASAGPNPAGGTTTASAGQPGLAGERSVAIVVGGNTAASSTAGQTGLSTGGVEVSVILRCPQGKLVAVSGPACGDGQLSPGEKCDDANTLAGDGCDGKCRIEVTWLCPKIGHPCTVCGNGMLDAREQCDDGNSANGDGCSQQCEVEPGYRCGFADDGGLCLWIGECGDGKSSPYGQEICDDGNVLGGDGCAADCRTVERGYVCRTRGAPCEWVAAKHPHCGNGMTEVEYGEECDDGVNDGGVCTADCRLSFCGDGLVQPQRGEACDDGVNGGDYGGCNASCVVSPFSNCRALSAYCGDGIIQPEHEACDDGAGNGSNGQCAANCTVVSGAYCGNGLVDADGEECDDGNSITCDGCSSNCLRETVIF